MWGSVFLPFLRTCARNEKGWVGSATPPSLVNCIGHFCTFTVQRSLGLPSYLAGFVLGGGWTYVEVWVCFGFVGYVGVVVVWGAVGCDPPMCVQPLSPSPPRLSATTYR